ncbi:MAG TPA: IS66 family insertion sequence element accessory protein TnpB [Tepidisphaeraceae bacterium]|jgi:hypothetical protein
MTLLPPSVKVHLAFGYTDMRKGIDGLAMLVQGMLRQDPFSGHLFVFRHVGEPDDGVERRAQLVAHARYELRLVLAGLPELAVLVLDFLKQPHVFDRDHRLVARVLISAICLSVKGLAPGRAVPIAPRTLSSRIMGASGAQGHGIRMSCCGVSPRRACPTDCMRAMLPCT